MEVEISKASMPETPASVSVENLIEHVTSIMVICGIEGISVSKYVSGFGSKLNVTISQFTGAPNEISALGVIVKDSIAQIMSVMNVTRIVVKPSESDLKGLREAWNMSVSDAKEANEGSGTRDGSGSSDGSGE